MAAEGEQVAAHESVKSILRAPFGDAKDVFG
jgi:hypothetical protein